LSIHGVTDFAAISPVHPAKGGVTDSPRKDSNWLPRGAQGQLIDATLLADKLGTPINRTTTIRTEKLRLLKSGLFADQHEADAVKTLLELMRHWHNKRGIPWACIWAREHGDVTGGHLHMGSHLVDDHTEAYIEQMALWTGEARVFPSKHKRDEIGISEGRNWLVQCCQRNGQSGTDIAAYLGKDEPTQVISAWRVARDNRDKRVTKYKCLGGPIEGTVAAEYRHGTSRKIAPNSEEGRKAIATFSDVERRISNLDWLPY
jgi:hypothetical protein